MIPQVLLPATLVALAFLLKLVVDRQFEAADFVMALLELPVDIAFLAMSLVVGFLIAGPADNADGLLAFIYYVIGAIVVVVLWRRSHNNFTRDKYRVTIGQALGGYLVCLTGLVIAIRLLIGVTAND